jgi:hypothetical protein
MRQIATGEAAAGFFNKVRPMCSCNICRRRNLVSPSRYLSETIRLSASATIPQSKNGVKMRTPSTDLVTGSMIRCQLSPPSICPFSCCKEVRCRSRNGASRAARVFEKLSNQSWYSLSGRPRAERSSRSESLTSRRGTTPLEPLVRRNRICSAEVGVQIGWQTLKEMSEAEKKAVGMLAQHKGSATAGNRMDERPEVECLHRHAWLVLQARIQREHGRVVLSSVQHHRFRFNAEDPGIGARLRKLGIPAPSEILGKTSQPSSSGKWIAQEGGKQRGIGAAGKQDTRGSEA